MPRPTAAVIICAYTEARYDDLLRGLDSLRAQTAPPDQVVVVVDHNDALLARVRAEVGDALVLPNRGQRGLSGARNSGLAAAETEVVAFLDDDAFPDPDWLERLLEGYRDPAVIAVGGAIRPAWSGRRPGWFPEEFDWVVGCTYRGMPTEARPVRNLIGANMSFRRDVFARVGGFTTGMGRIGTVPLGCEETELCIRARQRWPDRVILYQPRALVHHRVPASRASWRYLLSRCHAEGRSKAQVARLVGAADGLATERAYVLRTLPAGVLRGLADGWRGDPAGPGRAAAIVVGLAATALGYLSARTGALSLPASRSPAARPPAAPPRARSPG